MVLGLGTGSTAGHFVDLLGQALRMGVLHNVVGVPTSEATAARAEEAGVPLTTLEAHPSLDVTVDGADEVDREFNLIKGLGRALLREKIVAAQTGQYVIVVDQSKPVRHLGRGPLPVEIVPWAAAVTVTWLDELSGRAELWCEEDGAPIVTDNGNYLARCWFGKEITGPRRLAQTLSARAGVVEHGLFVDHYPIVIVARPGGTEVVSCSELPAWWP
jgi:ribose 5-phosphate isomerase A